MASSTVNRLSIMAFFALLHLPELAGAQPAARFDYSGVDAFWPLMATLQRGTEPSTAAWDRMFATPGYAALETREHRRAALQAAMRLAFMPALAAARDSAINGSGFAARSLRHLLQLPAARDSVERFREELSRSSVLDAARQRVAAFVPTGLTDSVASPPVALVFFLDDGRGYPTLIVGDLLRLSRAGMDTGYFAHEFYHAYRRRFAVAYRAPAAADAGLEELLAYPVEEGTADQLDKRAYAEMNDPEFASVMRRPGAPTYAPGYRDNYRRAADWMQLLSRALERAAEMPDSANAIARSVRDSLPDSGRPLGAFMARTIDQRLGRNALVPAGADQYAFWFEYDRAAARAGPGAPRLSVAAMQVIARLRAAYR